MNELNYASQEASKRLVDAGIVLKTDMYWCRTGTSWSNGKCELIQKPLYPYKEQYPAPSMAEVWRELPNGSTLSKGFVYDGAWCCHGKINSDDYQSTNPIDALIDLLIWVRKEKP